jgi:hypothetical protein
MWQKIPAFWSNQGFADDMPFLVVKIIPGWPWFIKLLVPQKLSSRVAESIPHTSSIFGWLNPAIWSESVPYNTSIFSN